jgi:hypothetical protein
MASSGQAGVRAFRVQEIMEGPEVQLKRRLERAEQQFRTAMDGLLTEQQCAYEEFVAHVHNPRSFNKQHAWVNSMPDVGGSSSEHEEPSALTHIRGRGPKGYTPLPYTDSSSDNLKDRPALVLDNMDQTVSLASFQDMEETVLAEITKDKGITPTNKVQEVFLKMVHYGKYFEMFSLGIVVSVCLAISLSVHCEMKEKMYEVVHERLDDDDSFDEMAWAPLCSPVGRYLWTWQAINAIAFTLEIVVRLLAELGHFFYGPHLYWNMFDLIMLGFNLASFIPWLPVQVRKMRVLRLLRMMRIFEFFPELRGMLYAIFACMSSLLWAFFLLFSFTLMIGLYFLEVTLNQMRLDHHQIKTSDLHILANSWNGVFDTVMALVASVTGGEDWQRLALPFFHLGTMGAFHGLVYTFFILFTTLGLLNVLVGVFVAKAEDFTNVSLDVALARAQMNFHQQTAHIEELFKMFDRTNDESLDIEEIKRGFENKRIQACFHHLGVDMMQPELMARIFDSNNNRQVDKDEFIRGCRRLQGAAKPVEVAEILELCQRMDQQLQRLVSDSRIG